MPDDDDKSLVDLGVQLMHDPVDFIASRVTDRAGRVNDGVRQVAREQAVGVVLVVALLWSLLNDR